MLTFRPTRISSKPKNNQEYNREKGGVIVTSSIENAKDVNRFGVIEKTPLCYNGDLQEGDQVVLHHNVFRSYYDMKGRERKSREYFKDNLYLVDTSKILIRKTKTILVLMIIVLSLPKARKIWRFP